MRTSTLATSFALLAAAPTLALAQEGLDYTWIELDAVARDIDAFDEDADIVEDLDDGDGIALNGSVGLGENLFLFGGYSQTESDVSYVSDEVFLLPSNTDIKRLDLGVGFHAAMTDRTDFVGSVGYVDVDFGDFEFGEDDDIDELSDIEESLDDGSNGYTVGLGLRTQLLDNLEGELGVRHLDIEGIDNTSLVGSLLFEMSPNWDLGFEIDAGDELSTYMLGVRFSPET